MAGIPRFLSRMSQSPPPLPSPLSFLDQDVRLFLGAAPRLLGRDNRDPMPTRNIAHRNFKGGPLPPPPERGSGRILKGEEAKEGMADDESANAGV